MIIIAMDKDKFRDHLFLSRLQKSGFSFQQTVNISIHQMSPSLLLYPDCLQVS